MSKPIDTLLDRATWTLIDYEGEMPEGLHATHEGVIDLDLLSFKCYQLSDGQRVLAAEDVERFFGETA